MQIVYGFVYYFMWTFICLSGLLLVFIFSSARRTLHSIQTKYQHYLNNEAMKNIINLSFVIIGLILIDSMKSYLLFNYRFRQHQGLLSKMGLQSIDKLQTDAGNSMLEALKQQRQYCLAERNIMLTLSALFVYYVFQKMFYSIRKLADEQHRHEYPQAQSVILQVISQLSQIGQSVMKSTQKSESQKLEAQRQKAD